MVPAYRNVRATGGAVASSPYRGRPWRGWMLLCFFLRAEESKNMARLCLAKRGFGESPSRVKPCWMQLLRRVIITLIPLEPLQ